MTVTELRSAIQNLDDDMMVVQFDAGAIENSRDALGTIVTVDENNTPILNIILGE